MRVKSVLFNSIHVITQKNAYKVNPKHVIAAIKIDFNNYYKKQVHNQI